MVPLAADDPGAAGMLAVRDKLAAWDNSVYVLFSTGDPVFAARTGDTIDDAAHFLQEDQGEEVGRRIASWLDSLG